MNRLVGMVLKNILRVPGAYGKLCRYARHPERYSEEEKYRHIQYIVKLAVKAGNVDLKVTGQENIPAEGGCMLYANHQGLFDAVAIGVSCDRPFGAVLKKELSRLPMIKQMIACTKSLAIDREDVRQSLTVIQSVTQEVKNGRCYLIFPEGTRSKNGNQMGQFHSGSFRCAVKAKCPVVPIALVDSYRVLDQKSSARVEAWIHYLKPIVYEEYKDMSTGELAAMVRSRIEEKIQENPESIAC